MKKKGSASQAAIFKNGLVTGMPDGIMLLFVGVTGLCAAQLNHSTVLLAGTGILVIGAITMGISAFTTSQEERRYFTDDLKNKELKERRFLANLGIGEDIQQMAAKEIEKDHAKWAGLMQSPPLPASAFFNGLAVTLGFGIGGMIPLIPFLLGENSPTNFGKSALLTLGALFITGYLKGSYTGARPLFTIQRIVIITLLAAACLYGAVRLIFG